VGTFVLSLIGSLPLVAGVIDDALNLPGLEAIKDAVKKGELKIEFKDIPPVKDSNNKLHTVGARQSGTTLQINSRVYGEGTNVGVIAQHIVHEYWHFKLHHKGNSKENERAVRRKEAEFWRGYKAAHPGTSNAACDANEKIAYKNGAFRDDADTDKKIHTSYGYPDDKDGKQHSSCIYDVSCPNGSNCTLTQNSCQSSLQVNGATSSVVPTSSQATIVVDPPDANNVSHFTVTSYLAQAPSITVTGFGATGPNTVSLGASSSSFGYIDRTTNKVVIYLNSQLTNGIYGPSNPIAVSTHALGTYDPGASRITLDTLAFDTVSTFSVPAVGDLLLAVLAALMLLCALMLLRRSREGTA
jgi:hypothetical protein